MNNNGFGFGSGEGIVFFIEDFTFFEIVFFVVSLWWDLICPVTLDLEGDD
ncbi:hypothetical protein A2U01_0063046 [Trifolium medium]|uniref:Transmembrane protein n=1 Tax=Trifolium medium TaxID=97028 RepID=A0A392S088_9FABA|nr:hypothetical protein [Trifolium medium]